MQDLADACRMILALQAIRGRRLRKGWNDIKVTAKGQAFAQKTGIQPTYESLATHGEDAWMHVPGCSDESCQGCHTDADKTHGGGEGWKHTKACKDKGCTGACTSMAFEQTDPMMNDEKLPTWDYTGFLPLVRGKRSRAKLMVHHKLLDPEYQGHGPLLHGVRAEIWMPMGMGGSGGSRRDPRDHSDWQNVAQAEISWWPRFHNQSDEWMVSGGLQTNRKILGDKSNVFLRAAYRAAHHLFQRRRESQDHGNGIVAIDHRAPYLSDDADIVEHLPLYSTNHQFVRMKAR